MIELITHKKRFDFQGVNAFSLLGKPIAGNPTPIPFDEESVVRSPLDDPEELGLKFEADEVPDTIHRFRMVGGGEYLFLIKDGVCLQGKLRARSSEKPWLLRVTKRLFSGKPKTISAAAAEPPPRVDGDGGGSVLTMMDDELFTLANDTNQSLLCDWRESADAIVEYANGFLPDELRLVYSESDSGDVVVTNSRGSFSFPAAELEAIEEPVPEMVRQINVLIAPSHQARSFNVLEGTDCYAYLLGPAAYWRALDAEDPEGVSRVFRVL